MLKKGDILFDQFLIDEEIGTGGTSTVFKAFDLQSNKALRAVKEIYGDEESIQDIIAESSLMAELYESKGKYNFIPNIIFRQESGGEFFIVMDYIDGVNMSELIKDGMPLSFDKTVEYGRDICSFMKFLHERHRLYSDMKPENIMVLRERKTNTGSSDHFSSLKFIDFGATINFGEQTTAYSPAYAAPEQYIGHFSGIYPDERTDIFNIGATLFHMITGRPGENVFYQRNNLITDLRPSYDRFHFDPDMNIDKGLIKIIQKCVKDDPKERYSSCSEVYRALERLSERKHNLISLILFGLSAIMTAAGIFSFSNYHKALDAKYSDYILKGDNSVIAEEKFEFYLEAVNIKPELEEGYLKLIGSCLFDEKDNDGKDDMLYTDYEGSRLRNVIALNQNLLIKKGTYSKIQYETGKLVLFYGMENSDVKGFKDSEKSRLKSSMVYFDEVRNSENDKLLTQVEKKYAGIYYHIADFYCNYQKRIEDGEVNEPVSIADLQFLADAAESPDESDYVRLEILYMVLDLLDDSMNTPDDLTPDSKSELVSRIKNIVSSINTVSVPSSDQTLVSDILDMC